MGVVNLEVVSDPLSCSESPSAHCFHDSNSDFLFEPLQDTHIMSRTNEMSVRQALQVAQNSETGQIDPRILRLLETQLVKVWTNIQANPGSYVMTETEFAVFNYFRARSELQNETARKAISRYWDNRRAGDGD